MRRVPESEVETDFERDICWGDDERHLYNKNKRKAAVMGYFIRLNNTLALAKKYIKEKRVADIACAQGNFGLMLAEAGYDVTAVDINAEFLSYAKKKHTHGKFQTEQANLMEFQSADPFDGVIMGEVIEHVAFPKDLLRSAARNLKQSGVLVLTTPNGNRIDQSLPTYSQVDDVTALIPKQFHWGDHLFLYTEEELRSLLDECGFDTLEVLKLNSLYVSQIKGLRYLFPLRMLQWFEKRTRSWSKEDQDSTENLIVVAKKR